jgi:GDPmannose 4,6-dehydratase
VIATGRSESLQYFASRAFAFYDLDWQDHVVIDKSLYRPSDIETSAGNPENANEALGWSAKVDVDGVIRNMCQGLIDGSGAEGPGRG